MVWVFYCGSRVAIVRCDIVTVVGSIKGSGRQKSTLAALVQKDLGLFDIKKHDAFDRAE